MAFHVLVSYMASTLHLTRSTLSIVSRDLSDPVQFDQTCFYNGPGVVISTSTCCFPSNLDMADTSIRKELCSCNNEKVFFDGARNLCTQNIQGLAALFSQQQSWEDDWDL